jgi:hypothetical protein
MNKRLDEVLSRVRSLPDEQQGEIADLLLDFLDQDDVYLTPDKLQRLSVAFRMTNLMQARQKCVLYFNDQLNENSV